MSGIAGQDSGTSIAEQHNINQPASARMTTGPPNEVPSGRIRRFGPPMLCTIVFLVAASVLRYSWSRISAYPLNGDEPHYLVLARALEHFHTFNITKAYREEFAARQFSPVWVGGLKSLPTPGTGAHTVLGPHGWAPLHSFGLPIALAIPLGLKGVTGVRAALILIGACLSLLGWFASGMFFRTTWMRVLATVTVTCALPFLPAASQVYPDLTAGVLCAFGVLACTRLALLEYGSGVRRTAWAAAFAAAVLPWLHLRFVLPSALIVGGLVLFKRRASRCGVWSLALLAVPWLVSLVALAAYNEYAYGSLTSSYDSNSVQVSTTSLMVLLGLHLDQFQGIFVQNPALILGVVGIAVLWRRDWRLGAFIALMWAVLVVPNAAFPNWYGGASFAGRFALTAAAVLVIPAMCGMATLRDISTKLFIGISATLLVLQAWYFVRIRTTAFDLINQGMDKLLSNYGSFLGPFQLKMPALYNSDWAFRYPPNYASLLLIVATVTALVVWPGANRRMRRAVVLVTSVAAAIAVLLLAATSADGPWTG